jgi:hypothetical protein
MITENNPNDRYSSWEEIASRERETAETDRQTMPSVPYSPNNNEVMMMD